MERRVGAGLSGLLAAIILTAIQIIASMLYVSSGVRSPGPNSIFPEQERVVDSGSAFQRLCVADCFWYWTIAERGYINHGEIVPQAPFQSNVAFFPAFPLAIRLVHAVTRLAWPTSTVLASCLATAGFWWLLFDLLMLWNVPRGAALLVAAAILAHPASIYFVAGLKESIFLMAFVAMTIACETNSWTGGIYGAVLTATRLHGITLGVYPLLRGALSRSRRRCLLAAALMPAGALAFFAYCQIRFGAWNLYMRTQKIGWGHRGDLLFFLHSSTYRLSAPYRKTVVGLLAAFVAVAAVELLVWLRQRPEPAGGDDEGRERRRRRWAFWIAAAALYYFTAAGSADPGLAGGGFPEFTRYTMPIFVIMLLAGVNTPWIAGGRLPLPKAVVAAGCVLSLFAMVYLGLLHEAVPMYNLH